MYPKDLVQDETSPRASSKEMSLMERMYLKMEALCVETDKNPSFLIQEASKYVESHVSTVGKMCSEFIRDLLPPPDEELTECKHAQKCSCKSLDAGACRDSDEKTDDQRTESAAVSNPCEQQPAEQVKEAALDSDTILEPDEQAARWYDGGGIILAESSKPVTLNQDDDAAAAACSSDSEEWELL